MITRERSHSQFVFHITNLLSQIKLFGDFILFNQGYDSFMEVDLERHLQLRTLYETCSMASVYLENQWQVESLQEMYRRDQKQWNDNLTFLHEATLDYMLKKLQVVFPTLVRKALILVTQTQVHYWKHRDPVFLSLCFSSELQSLLQQFEQQSSIAMQG